MSINKDLKNCIMLVLGSAILAFGLYNIHSISNVTEGGILGLTLLLQHFFRLSPSLTGFLISIVCYGVGCIALDKRFVIYSIIASVGFSVFYAVFEQFSPIYAHIADMPLTAAIVGALFVGVGIGLCVRAGGAPGGDDALAMGLSRITGKSIQTIYLIQDMTVLALSLSYIPLNKIVYSVISVILSGQLIGLVASTKLGLFKRFSK